MNECDCVPGHRCDCWDYRPSPDPVAGLREAAEDILRNVSTYHDVGSIHERLRAALHREAGT